MQATTFPLGSPDGVSLFVHCWLPEKSLKAVVQVAHGWGEHAGRYARVSKALCREGYAVYGNEHRGHGRTARAPAEPGFFAESGGRIKCVDDLWRLHQRIATAHPAAPIVAFGHSMGSFMMQQFIFAPSACRERRSPCPCARR